MPTDTCRGDLLEVAEQQRSSVTTNLRPDLLSAESTQRGDPDNQGAQREVDEVGKVDWKVLGYQ